VWHLLLLANSTGYEYNLIFNKLQFIWRSSVPVSKKRVKKSQKRKSPAPPPSKAELSNKKKPLNRQQIAIYVVSALVVLSMTIGFIISGLGTNTTTTPTGGSDVNIQELLATPAPGESSGDTGDTGSSEQNADTATSAGDTTE
jgi:hypothetical protein